MERHGGELRADYSVAAPPPPFTADGGHYHYDDWQELFHSGHHQQHQPDHCHHHNFNVQPNESTGFHLNGDSGNSLPLTGHKRPLPPCNNVEYGGIVKLYAVGIPRTATEQDVSTVFGEFGDIIEVVLVRDKRTGLQQEYCFVKYARVEQAEQAIAAFNGQYTFPGAMLPLKVKYAERERKSLGSYLEFLNTLIVKDLLQLGTPLKPYQYYGGFSPAISAQIHKLYVGCLSRQALKRDIEEIFSPFGVIEEIFIVKDEFKQNRGCCFVQYATRDMALAAIHALHGIHMMKGCDQPLIVRFADPKKPRLGDSRPASHSNDPASAYMLPFDMQQMKFSQSGCKIGTMANNDTAPVTSAFDSSAEIENSTECDWSEHVSPDGDFYYYNCVTCESRWDKPEEYADYEELGHLEEQQQNRLQDSKSLSSPSCVVSSS